MKLKQKYKLSQVALNAVTDEVTDLVQSKLISLEQKLHNVLGGVLTNEQLSSINDILKQQDLTNPFGGLRNAYQQEAYFTTYLDYQKPVRRELGGETDKQDVVYDIPFLKSLQLLLKHDILRNKVLQGHERADGLLGDFCDGSLFKMHPLFSADKTALQIQLYYDDVEICNPLGSRAKKHKLALFYFTIGNIPPKYRSPLANIHLLCVTKSVTLQKYGAHKVLQPIMNKIKKLEEDGISIKTDDCVHHFYGTISVFQGDNLGSQFIGGYKSLASAHRKCRHCLSVSDDMQSKFLAHEFKERNRSTHEYHIRALKTNSATHEHISKSFGINEDSVLHKSTYFHITEGLVPDIMHDVLEGCLPYVVKEMLKVFISHKFISLSLLEKIISKFPYGITDKANKPSVISSTTLKNKDHNLKQTATEMWCLARLLPIMIGNHIPKDNPYWLHFLALLEIVDYLFAPIISTECLDHMRILIRDHHSAFKELYPECNLIPKMHYMVHYPDWIQRF
uniref:Uncharacterized protein n=1 Tax=Amphimedon queenslandica TaxID=400682 RepID=A0A1X7V4A6_AMPQE